MKEMKSSGISGKIIDRALEQAPVLIKDSDHIIIFWGKPLQKIYGYSGKEAVGKNANELLHTIFPVTPKKIAGVLTKKDEWEGELQQTAKNGSVIFVKSTWKAEKLSGEIEFIIEVVTDITKQKQAEAGKRKNESIYRLLASNLLNGKVFILDRDLRITFAEGPSLSLGEHQAGLFEGKNITELYEADRARLYGSLFSEAFRGRSLSHEFSVQNRHYRMEIIPLYDEIGNVVNVVAMQYDITWLRLNEQQLGNKNSLLQNINRIFTEAMSTESEEYFGEICLKIALITSGSKVGFIGEKDKDGIFRYLAGSQLHWDLHKTKNKEINRLFVKVLENGQSYYTNNPGNEINYKGEPEGPSPENFLGIPLLYEGSVIGMIGLANKKGGYSNQDADDIESLTPSIVEALLHKRAELALKDNENVLSSILEQLPVGVGLFDSTGELIIRNSRMQKLLPKNVIPAFDPERSEKWHITDKDGGALPLEHWPGLRALRGETVVPGIEILHSVDRTTKSWLNISAAPFVSTGKIRDGAIIVAEDITLKKITEENLEKTEKAYLELVQQAPAGIYSIDFRRGKFTAVNDTMCRLSGYSREELLSMDPILILDKESRMVFQERIKEWTGGGLPPKTIEYKIITKDGRYIDALLNVTFIKDENGIPMGASVVAHDITERKNAERALQQSETLLHSVIEQMPSAIIIRDVKTGKVIFSNKLSKKLMGNFKNTFDDFPEYKAFHKDGRLYRTEEFPIYRSVTTGEIVVDEEFDLHRDDKLITLQVSSFPIRNEKGEILMGAAIFNDITESKKANRLYKETEELFYKLFENTPDAVLIGDPEREGMIQMANNAAQKLFGYDQQEFCMLKRENILRRDDSNESRNILKYRNETGHAYRTLSYMKKDGTEFTGEVSSTFFHDRNNQKRALTIIRDITEKLKYENELKSSREKLMIALETAELGITEYDYTSRVAIWDPRLRAIWGLSENEEITWEKFMNGIHPDDREYVQTSLFACSETTGDGKCILHYRVINPSDGKLWWLNSIGKVTFDKDKPVRYIGVVQNITDQKLIEEKLISGREKFELLSVTAGELLQSDDPLNLINSLCRKVMDYIGCEVFFNFLLKEAEKKLYRNAFAGVTDEQAKLTECLNLGVAVCGNVALSGNRIIAEQIQSVPNPMTDLIKSFGIKAYACHPILAGNGKVIGTLSFGSKSRDKFTVDDISLMKAVTNQVAIAMNRLNQNGAGVT